MEYFVIVIALVVSVVVIFWFSKLKQNKHKSNENYTTSANDNSMMESEMNELMIQLEELPMNAISNTSKLVEITNSTVVARVNNIITGVFHSGNAGRNAVNGMNSRRQVLYRVVTSSPGAELIPSKELPGAVRGIVKSGDKIKEHANLVKVEQKTNVVSNATSSAMGVAAMIVGQYYMSEINTKLGEISEEITKVSEFQDNEYRSKVITLVAQVQKMAKFQAEILNNNELRLFEINNLNQAEKECTHLLEQASQTLEGFMKKNGFKYIEYEKQLGDIQKWYIYQNILMEILVKIAELKHALHLGGASREYCSEYLSIYSKQVNKTNENLRLWHNTQCEKLVINIDEFSRKREGFDSVLHAPLGLINEGSKYRRVSNEVVNTIVMQSKGCNAPEKLTSRDLFQEDVKIIAKEGKLYYLSDDEEK